MRRLLLAIVVLLCAPLAHASDIYFAAVSAGSNNGTSCANAYAYTDGTHGINVAANWVAGNNLHICGTITLAYNTNFITAAGSGTSGSPITIVWEPGAIVQSPACPAAGCIVISSRSYIVVNGDVTNGRQGIIENTDVGTNLDHQGQSRAIYANGCTPGCTVENLTIEHIYDHLKDQALSSISGNGTTVTVTCAANCNVKVGNQYGIYGTTATALNSYHGTCTVGSQNSGGYCNVATVASVSGTQFTYASTITASGTGGVVDDGVLDNTGWNAIYYGLNTSTGFTINNVLAHDVSWAFNGWGSNITIANSEVYNADHGIAFGAGANASGLVIHDNHFHDFANWDAASNENHHDYIHIWDHVAGTAVTGSQIYRNLFDGDFGTTTTAPIYQEDDINSSAIFNNICHLSSEGTGYTARLCFHLDHQSLSGDGNSIYNNYCQVDGTPQNGGGCLLANAQTHLTVLNNVFIGGQYPLSIGASSTIATSCNGLTQCVDYNFYEDMNADYGNTGQFGFNGTNYTTLAAWRTGCSCDAHALIDPLSSMLYSSYKPQTSSPGIGAATNLTGLSITALDSDYGLSARPSVGAWDIGAYNFSATTQVATPTFSPVSGTYATAQSVTISDSTAGATICYTLDGSTPTTNGAGGCTGATLTYSVAINVSVTTTINAIGTKSGDTDSTAANGVFTIGTPPSLLPPKSVMIAVNYGTR